MDFNAGWPVSTHLVFTGRNALSLRSQNSHIRRVLHCAFLETGVDLAFTHAFPEHRSLSHFDTLLVECAAHVNELDIKRRIQQDLPFAQCLAAQVCALSLLNCLYSL